MVETFAFYCQTYDSLPEKRMKELAGNAKLRTTVDEDGKNFVFSWPHLTVTVNEMPAKQIPAHLNGFCGYIQHIYGDSFDERGEQIIDRIQHTRMVVGITIDPERDDEGLAEDILGTMAYGLDAIIFHASAIFDKDAKMILAPDRSYDRDADILGPLAESVAKRVQVKLPNESQHEPTQSQKDRYKRVHAELAVCNVPTLPYPLLIDDDDNVELRTAPEVAKRILILTNVVRVADGGDLKQAQNMIEKYNLWSEVTPEESKLLKAKQPDEDHARGLLWRLESLWALVWALGELDLPWPSGFCHVPKLMQTVEKYETQVDHFSATAQLRSKKEILDALQLTLLQHWAIRDAHIHNREIPADLKWVGNAEMLPTQSCPVTGVVAERHHALNWLVRLDDAQWDEVDTAT